MVEPARKKSSRSFARSRQTERLLRIFDTKACGAASPFFEPWLQMKFFLPFSQLSS